MEAGWPLRAASEMYVEDAVEWVEKDPRLMEQFGRVMEDGVLTSRERTVLRREKQRLEALDLVSRQEQGLQLGLGRGGAVMAQALALMFLFVFVLMAFHWWGPFWGIAILAVLAILLFA